jgi:hypothetical protein
MSESLERLESRKREMLEELISLQDFRRGTITRNFRKCGKVNCVCAKEGHPGHGPQYLWTATEKGQKRAKNLRLGPELEKVAQEVENYRRWSALIDELVQISGKICELKPVKEIDDQQELDRLKKKLQKRFNGKSAGRSSG